MQARRSTSDMDVRTRIAWASMMLLGCGGAPQVGSSDAVTPAWFGARVMDRPPLSMEPHVLSEEERAAILARPERVVASTTYRGYDVSRALDGNPATSWFSARDDSAARGKQTFVELGFTRPQPLRRVVILGNREPRWMDGFTVRAGRIDVFDAFGTCVFSAVADATGDRGDFAFEIASVDRASRVRFTSVSDDGAKNEWGDVAIAEISLQ